MNVGCEGGIRDFMGLFVWNSMNTITAALTQKGFPPYGRVLDLPFLPPFPLHLLESNHTEQR